MCVLQPKPDEPVVAQPRKTPSDHQGFEECYHIFFILFGKLFFREFEVESTVLPKNRHKIVDEMCQNVDAGI